MGWSSGSELAEDVWDAVSKYIPKAKRRMVAKQLVTLFEMHDCDTICEAEELCRLAHDHSDDE